MNSLPAPLTAAKAVISRPLLEDIGMSGGKANGGDSATLTSPRMVEQSISRLSIAKKPTLSLGGTGKKENGFMNIQEVASGTVTNGTEANGAGGWAWLVRVVCGNGFGKKPWLARC